jgi:hypothetical protein
VGQGLDRLLNGGMSLWELGAIKAGWNANTEEENAANGGKVVDFGPPASASDWDELRAATRRTVAAADARKAAEAQGAVQ